MSLIELSHLIEEGMVTYPGIPAPKMLTHLSFEDSHDHYDDGTEFFIGGVVLMGNTGTYIDSPAHRHRGGMDLAALPLASFADLPGVVVRDKGPQIEASSLDEIDTAGKAVLFHTGHASKWGSDSYFTDHPYLIEETARALVEGRAALVGIDSLNIDGTATGSRPVHTALLAAEIPIVEHLTGLELIPDTGFTFTAAPARVAGMVSIPVRAYANVP